MSAAQRLASEVCALLLLRQEQLQLAIVLELHDRVASSNVLAIDEDVGDGLLASQLFQTLLDLATIFCKWKLTPDKEGRMDENNVDALSRSSSMAWYFWPRPSNTPLARLQ